MKGIGWTVTCALLVIGFSKNALAKSVGIVEFQKKNTTSSNSEEITRLVPVSKDPIIDPDIQQLRRSFNDISGSKDQFQERSIEHKRTFGHKRIQFMLMPMMYKMGAMMTMLMILTIISLKGLAVGVFILVLKLSTFLAKFSSGWQHHPTGGWSPQQPIHLHLHNSHAHPYGAWEPVGPPEDDHFFYKG